jgi:hypothetical protein
LKITKALIVAYPWIDFLLDGSKTWEMRSTGTSHRGWFGLIRKGTSAVYGVARLVDVGRPLTLSEMLDTFHHHRIPEATIRSGGVSKWNTPWQLADIRRLASPVPYRHKSGAVTWVRLDADVSGAIGCQMGDASAATLEAQPAKPQFTQDRAPAVPRPIVPLPAIAERQTQFGSALGSSELTQGNIDHSHIYLREFFNRFPDEVIGGSSRDQKAMRDILIDWGGAAPAETDLDGTKRFFRARGWIKTFFETNGAAAGDSVLVEQTGPYRYRVRLKKKNGTR